ncbi:MAG: thioredoxin domain-containing protein, partial [Candidatus Accumulibacter sp.]|nr:thioredoxin domain-containing protein [Accumulibacter sp.]
KMLYDNALLVVAYVEAFQLTGRPDFARVARETCDYVLREMRDAAGAFYSATDADSEGEEGRFFVWRADEIRHELKALGDDQATRLFLEHYDVQAGGNWQGWTILNVPRPDEQRWARLAAARQRLYEVRLSRLPPLRDEKILAAWNGLMISALALAGRVLEQPHFVAAAARAADFVLAQLRGADGELRRSFKDGQARQAAFLDDHAFLAAGLIDLYEASFELRYLREALALAEATEELFADPIGGWFMTGPRHEALIAREKPAHDGAEPSGTSLALINALRLAVFTDDDRWRQVAERGLRAHAELLRERPMVMAEALLALDLLTDTPLQVAIVWPDGAEADGAVLQSVLRSSYLPSRALAGGPASAIEGAARTIPFLREKLPQGGRPTAFVCRLGRCQLPVTEATALTAQLGAARS